MAKRTVMCPLCFDKIKLSDILYRCGNPACLGMADIARSADEIHWLEKIGLKLPPRSVIHTKCGNLATKRICPKCQQELPVNVDKLSNYSIAIIGAKDAGKSHYVAMLIHWIKKAGADFGWNLTELSDRTIERYHQEFFKPLFEHHVPIDTTQAVRGGTAEPLIYSLNKGSKSIMLVFFDAAGENLNSADDMWYIERYICNASGIICLLDPLQLTLVRREIGKKYGNDVLPDQHSDTASIINRVENIIRKHTDVGIRKLPIPLAVAFSKMDFVEAAGCNAEAIADRLSEETLHRGVFNETEFTEIDGLMRSWVEEVDISAGIIPQSQQFKKTGFFGFSALGCNPRSSNGNLEHDPKPNRVEDPFLWILKQCGVIKSIKG
ncbi:MAG: hypothetical protein E7048_07495 [Lentisphaerae bacterium]|nr:hypothetical protein [Lentisphaerota bacterium]